MNSTGGVEKTRYDRKYFQFKLSIINMVLSDFDCYRPPTKKKVQNRYEIFEGSNS